MQEQCVGIIRNLSMNEANEIPMMEEGVLPPLIELLRSLNERIQASTPNPKP